MKYQKRQQFHFSLTAATHRFRTPIFPQGSVNKGNINCVVDYLHQGVLFYFFLIYLVHCSVTYQSYRIDSVESANSILQVLTGQPAKKIADGANTVHNHINIHSRLQTRRDGQLSHRYIHLYYQTLYMMASWTVRMRDTHVPTGWAAFPDLRSQQLCHLSVVATEHLLQTQPKGGGKVKHMQATKRWGTTKLIYLSQCFLQTHTSWHMTHWKVVVIESVSWS